MKSRKPRGVLAVASAVILILLLVPTPSHAGYSSQLTPVSDLVSGGNSGLSDIAIAPSGEALIVWTEGDGAPVALKARRLRPDGSLGPVLAISDPTLRAGGARVSFAPNGRAIVAWVENAAFGAASSVRARWIEPDDTLAPQFTVRTGSMASDSGELSLTATSTNDAVAVWHNFSSTPGPFRTVEGRRIAAAGTVGNLILPASSAGSQGVRVEPNSAGGTLFAWDETTGIRSQSWDAADVPGFLQSPATGTTAFLDLATDGADGFHLVYRKETSSIEYRALAADGTAGPEQTVDGAGPANFGLPDVDTNAANRSLIAWPREISAEQSTVNARFVTANGTLEAETASVIVPVIGSSAVVGGIGGDGGGAIAWTEESATEARSLWGRILPSAGNPSPPVRLSSTGGVSRSLLEMAANNVGLSAWSERVDPSSSTSQTQIFVRQIIPLPTCAQVAATVIQGRPTRIDLGCAGLQLEAPQIVDPPDDGVLEPPDSGTQSVLYTPEAGFDGADTFTFAGANRGGVGATQTATVTVGRDTVKPKIKKFKITRKRVEFSRAAPGKGKKPTFKLRFSEQATAKIVIEKRNRCSSKNCKKFKRTGKLRSEPAAFSAEVVLPKRLGGKPLRPATYRATAIAEDPAGNRSKRKRLKFTVLRP